MVRVEKIGCWGLFVTLALYGQQARSELLKIDDLKQMTLTQLLELEVITPSRIEQRLIDSAANITVLTQNMIRQRGYKNLVEILQDLPGFDFATYEDGGGEYPTHSLNRGIGGNPGNPKLLILVDGIAQNHIGFNWSQLFGEEQLYQDLERIEILQGPASAVYGANAFSGIIHFITQRKVTSNKTRSTLWFGQNNTRTFSAFHQSKIDNIHINGAFKLFKTDGDGGIGRPDPAGYFHNNAWPTFVSENFDADGNFHTGGPNPNAGQLLPNGFNTNKDNWSVRANINYFAPNKDNSQNGLIKASGSLFVWNKREGLGSYTPGYEYQSTAESFQMHHSAQLFSAEMDYRISPKLLTTFSAWYRQNRQLPQTGFQYSYRFPSLIKSYHSLNTQWGLEQQFKWDVSSTDLLLIGLRYIANDKMDQVTSLGEFQDGHDPVTTSSWSHATNQLNPQLGQAERVQVYQPDEQALYATYDGRFNSALSYSAGLRVDHSDDYNTTVNPRVGLIYQVPNNLFTHWNLKFLYGEAFREPSIFELTDEFRGNRNLSPEEIKTSEILSQLSWQTDESQVLKSINLKTYMYTSP
jgi:outer membrane receptor protein involved in Fe transport